MDKWNLVCLSTGDRLRFNYSINIFTAGILGVLFPAEFEQASFRVTCR
jgi:hypothetical protein